MHEALGSIPQYKLGVMVHTCNLSPQWWRQGDAKLSSAIQGAVGQSGKHETLSQGKHKHYHVASAILYFGS